MYQNLSYEIMDQAAIITLNRPEKMNALDEESAPELVQALEEAAADEQVRVVILTGAEKIFSAGGNVRMMYNYLSEHPDKGPTEIFRRIVDQLNRSVLLLRTMPKPVIAAVNGVAAGGALGWVLASDLVLAAPGVKFDTAYLRIAVSPDGGNTFFLPRLLGPWKAAEMFFLGQSFTAEEAKEMGLVNRIVEHGFLLDEARNLAAKLARQSAPALARTKALLNLSMESSLAHTLEQERTGLIQSVDEPQFRTAINAFFNKS